MGESAQVAYPNRAPKKFVTFGEEEERRQPQRAKRVLCCKAVLTSGPPMMSKTVLDLLHSLGVEDDMIMFDNFGGICEQIRSIFSQRRCPNFGG